MNIQDLLTYLFNALAFGYVALMMLDVGSRLGGGLSDSFCSTAAQGVDAPATPVDLPSLHPADEGVLISLTPLEVVAEERVSSLSIPPEVVASKRVLTMAVPLVVADPWRSEVEITATTCCCHTATFASPPQLLLPQGGMLVEASPSNTPPGLEVSNQPDLATMPNTELRKLCQSAGIKWRNAHGTNKHLSKNQMITALG